MQIHFHPPTLAASRQAPAIYQFIMEFRPTGLYGQFFVEKDAEDEPVHLKFKPVQGPVVSVPFEERLLCAPAGKELREKVAELVGSAKESIGDFVH